MVATAAPDRGWRRPAAARALVLIDGTFSTDIFTPGSSVATLTDDPTALRPARRTQDDQPAIACPRRRVLVVDDDHDTADSTALLLTMLGHEVRTVYDGPSALAAADARPPDFVLLDIGLPGMDGYEVARRLRSRPGREGVAIIAVSGYGRDEDKRRAHEAGCDAHLTKPADPNSLFVLLANR